MRIRNSCRGLTVLFLVGLGLCEVFGNFKSEEFERRLIALFKIVDYVARRPGQMNLDAIFGITLTEAHVMATLKHENSRLFGQEYLDVLSAISNHCKNARLFMMSNITLKNEEHVTLSRAINRPDIWTIRSIFWKSGTFGPGPSASPELSVEDATKLIYQGSPREIESDRCLLELAEDSMTVDGLCQVSNDCANMLLRNDHARGYPLTHRLLYVQIALALGCQEHPATSFHELIPIYCSLILQDLVDLEATNFPAMSRDLISEQVLLCGMEGYLEFVSNHYANLILSWPNFIGCFSAYGFRNESEIRTKRNSFRTDFACDNHATALGAANFALLIRHYVETVLAN